MRTSGRESDMGIIFLTLAVFFGLSYYLFGGIRPFLYWLDQSLRELLSMVAALVT